MTQVKMAKRLRCPKCKKEMVYCFRYNSFGGSYIKCDNKSCVFCGIPRQIDVESVDYD